MKGYRPTGEYEKELVKHIDQLVGQRQRWQIWQDIILAVACSLSIATDGNQERAMARKKEMDLAVERLGGIENASKAFDLIVEGMEANHDQDFLGSIYMKMELGSHWHGQFFTPYSICQMMAKICIDESKLRSDLENQGYITCADCACGAGATLVAAANFMKEQGINYQRDAMFVGQDIDRVAGMMCYIQLSLLGCPGYVCIASTITNPVVGDPILPEEKPEQEFWYTPFFFREEWSFRRQAKILRRALRLAEGNRKEANKEKFTFFFNFEEDENGRETSAAV